MAALEAAEVTAAELAASAAAVTEASSVTMKDDIKTI